MVWPFIIIVPTIMLLLKATLEKTFISLNKICSNILESNNIEIIERLNEVVIKTKNKFNFNNSKFVIYHPMGSCLIFLEL